MLKLTKNEKIFQGIIALFLFIFMIICVYPIIYVILASFSDSNLLMAHTGVLWKPLNANLNSYVRVFQNTMILIGYKNTLILVVAGVCVNMAMTVLGAYFLSRKGVKWQKPVLILILFTMYFSGGIIPFYLTVKAYGLEDTFLALILPSAINTFNLLVTRTAFYNIPDSLLESAIIDGAGNFTILTRICLPIIKPTLAVIVLYYAVERWNSWFGAAIFINSYERYPLQLVLRQILISNDTNSMTNGGTGYGDVQSIAETIKYAVIVVSTLPIMCMYPFLQKYFVSGVMIGAVKG